MNYTKELTELLDENCGYVEEQLARTLAKKLTDNGVILSHGILETILRHGQYSATKWLGNKNNREYWDARYTAVALIYRDLTDTDSWLDDFNKKCGVIYDNGTILSADGTLCDNR